MFKVKYILFMLNSRGISLSICINLSRHLRALQNQDGHAQTCVKCTVLLNCCLVQNLWWIHQIMKSACILCTNSDLGQFWVMPVGATGGSPRSCVWAVKPEAEKLLQKCWVVPGHAGAGVI